MRIAWGAEDNSSAVTLIITSVSKVQEAFSDSHLGKVRTKQLPFPDSDFILILPSCKVMICLHRLNPMPEPDVWVVENWIGGVR